MFSHLSISNFIGKLTGNSKQPSTATIYSLLYSNNEEKKDEPSLSEPDRFEEILRLVLSDFVDGKTHNANIKRELTNNSSREVRETKPSYVLYKEDEFISYDANRIKDATKLIACHGPNSKTIFDFFKMILDSKIHTVISFAYCLGNEEGDFYDYCSGIRPTLSFSKNGEHITVKFHGNPVKSCYLIHIHQAELEVECYNNKIMNKTTSKLKIITFPLRDNRGFNMAGNENNCRLTGEKLEAHKAALWESMMRTFDTNGSTLIHCHAGMGRTGHFILMRELLKHYHTIFAPQFSPQKVAHNIKQTLARIRENRPALVDTRDQFEYAIRNVKCLYEYALQNNYIQPNQPVDVSALQLANKKAPEQVSALESIVVGEDTKRSFYSYLC